MAVLPKGFTASREIHMTWCIVQPDMCKVWEGQGNNPRLNYSVYKGVGSLDLFSTYVVRYMKSIGIG